VHANDVIGNGLVGGCINCVKHDKQQIKTGEQRILQSNVFHGRFELIVLQGKFAVTAVAKLAKDLIYPSVNRVGSSHDRAASVQTRLDTSLGNGDTPLFHHLVDCCSVNVSHLVEFVDANHASISQHHGTRFQTAEILSVIQPSQIG
jgi:hypothetical protein